MEKYKFKFNNKKGNLKFTDDDILIARSPMFKLSVKNSFESLKNPYLDKLKKNTLIQFIKLLLHMAFLPKDEKCKLMEAQLKIIDSTTMIPKNHRIEMVKILSSYKKFWDPRSSTINDDNNNVEKVLQAIEELKVEQECVIKKCFFGLIYGEEIHPRLHDTIEKADANKWHLSYYKVVVYCLKDREVFDDIFTKTWQSYSNEDPDLNDYKPDEVLKLISYVKSDGRRLI